MADADQRTIAITRPFGKGKDTAEFVRGLGWTPFIFHTVELEPLNDGGIREQVRSCLAQGPLDWIVFMSSSGVKLLLDNLDPFPDARDLLRKTRFLSVGPRTRETLARHGLTQVSVPDKYSSAGVDEFFSRSNIGNQRIALVRSSAADDSLANSLSSRGAMVTTISVYRSNLPSDLRSAFAFLEGLSNGKFSAVLFTSAISVSNLFKIAETRFGEGQITRLLNRTLVGAIGPVTAEELRRRGVETILPQDYLIENAVNRLINRVTIAQA